MAQSKHKIGDLVRVRDDAGELHLRNEEFEGQMGVVIKHEPSGSYPYRVKFLTTGRDFVFCDEELEGPNDDQQQ